MSCGLLSELTPKPKTGSLKDVHEKAHTEKDEEHMLSPMWDRQIEQ